MPPTLRDISARANISESTASLILNGRKAHLFAVETRERVIRIAKEMGYRPRRAAQTLATGRTNHIAVILNDLANPFFGRYASLIQAELVKHGLTAIPLETQGQEVQTGQWLDWLPQRAVDAMIDLQGFMGANQHVYEMHGTHVPVIFRQLWPLDESLGLDHVYVDYDPAHQQLIAHLVATGRRQAGFLVVPGQVPTKVGPRYRTQGLIKQFSDGGFDVHPRYWRGVAEASSPAEWYAQAVDLLKAQPDIDTLFVHNVIAVPPVLRAMADCGRALGRDIALASSDDAPQAEWLGPGITVVCEPYEEVAGLLVNMLLRKMNRVGGKPRSTRVDTQLIVRGSTDPSSVGKREKRQGNGRWRT